tara:strand:- start:155 stop:376 length:222 start_codon:yes stop_codon:yes gene_type:complete
MKKTKGYSKGGMKMMKAMKGKMMAKGMRKGGVKTAMGGRMMAKGMRKGQMVSLTELRKLAKKKGFTLTKIKKT